MRIQELEEEIADKDSQLADQKEQIAVKNSQLADKDAKIRYLKEMPGWFT